ncbi:MAG: LysR family transcriptional regulator [Lachnospiraceae bacterium]|nr:LysR family transcriptional regulator [Lachnospiraceae bacterium]
MISQNDEYFLEIIKRGGLSKASESLFISQPSLTKRMRSLEKQLGVSLFQRDTKPLKLNAAGEVYRQYLERMVAAEKDLSNKLQEASSEKQGILRIGIPPLFGQAFLPDIIPGFHATYPLVRLELTEANGTALQRAVAENRIDLAFVHMPIMDVHVDYEAFSEEHILLAANHNTLPAGLPITEKDGSRRCPMRFELLSDFLYILPREGQMLYRYSVGFLTNRHITPNVLVNCGHTITALNLAAKTANSATFIPEYLMQEIPTRVRNRLTFFYLDGPELKWDFCALFSNEYAPGIYAQEMLRMVRETRWGPSGQIP